MRKKEHFPNRKEATKAVKMWPFVTRLFLCAEAKRSIKFNRFGFGLQLDIFLLKLP